jgi:hypothetical protein
VQLVLEFNGCLVPPQVHRRVERLLAPPDFHVVVTLARLLMQPLERRKVDTVSGRELNEARAGELSLGSARLLLLVEGVAVSDKVSEHG